MLCTYMARDVKLLGVLTSCPSLHPTIECFVEQKNTSKQALWDVVSTRCPFLVNDDRGTTFTLIPAPLLSR